MCLLVNFTSATAKPVKKHQQHLLAFFWWQYIVILFSLLSNDVRFYFMVSTSSKFVSFFKWTSSILKEDAFKINEVRLTLTKFVWKINEVGLK
jgi:hypothetical protein